MTDSRLGQMPGNLRELVLDKWRSENIPLKEPLSPDKIVGYLEKLGISASPELLEVYFVLSQFDEDEMDNECLNFWSLKKVTKENRAGADSIRFADFLIDSHLYTFRIESNNSISIYVDYLNGEKIKIADSFASFFRLYLHDVKKLFP